MRKPSADEDAEQLELSHTTGGDANGTDTVGRLLQSQHTSQQPYSQGFAQLQQKCMFSKESLYTNVYSDFIHNHQKLGGNPNAFLLMNDKVSYILTALLSNEQ